MTLDGIRELINREPFTPFRIILTSGKEYDVTNPDLVALGQTQVIIYEARSDRYSILRLNQLSSIDVQQPA
jgi:hypothetical protein